MDEMTRKDEETKESTSAAFKQIHYKMDENFRKLFEADHSTRQRLTVVEDKHTELEKNGTYCGKSSCTARKEARSS
jgi:hypothetical protein